MGRKRRLRELERRVLDLEEAAVREFTFPSTPRAEEPGVLADLRDAVRAATPESGRVAPEPAPKRSDQTFREWLQREVVGKRVERFEIVPVSAAEERVVLHFHGGNRLLFSHPSGVFTLTGLGPQGAS